LTYSDTIIISRTEPPLGTLFVCIIQVQEFLIDNHLNGFHVSTSLHSIVHSRGKPANKHYSTRSAPIRPFGPTAQTWPETSLRAL
jgi:hypothetical protein